MRVYNMASSPAVRGYVDPIALIDAGTLSIAADAYLVQPS